MTIIFEQGARKKRRTETMGRTKTNGKQKSNVPIPFPHDGPVFRHNNSCHQDKQHTFSLLERRDSSLELAVRVLDISSDNNIDDGTCDSYRSENSLLIVNLIRNLQKTNTTTKEQLQALQLYKCSFLNLSKQQLTKGDEELSREDLNFVIGLYRLLLEWSLSKLTPLPFQRAIQSNLKTLGSSIIFIEDDTICKEVLESIWKTPEKWEDPLHSLDVSVNHVQLREKIILSKNHHLLAECLSFLGQCRPVSNILKEKKSSSLSTSSLSSKVVDDALYIVTMLKVLLGSLDTNAFSTETENDLRLLLERFEAFVFALLTCSNLPSDGFNALGILYGKLLILSIGSGSGTEPIIKKTQTTTMKMIELCNNTVAALGSNKQQYESLSPLARLSMVQGIAATLDADILLMSKPVDEANLLTTTLSSSSSSSSSSIPSPLEVCWTYSLQVGQTSTDPLARWAALKGLSTLAGRWKQQQSKMQTSAIKNTDGKQLNSILSSDFQQQHFHYGTLIQKTLVLVFDSWENPPLRKLGMAIPGLFKALVQLLPQKSLQGLCQQVLDQPQNRKGRYLALEILLPYIPITSEQDQPSSSSAMIPVESLLEGIGSRGSNAGSIANLWIKMLKRAWSEFSQSDATASEFNDSFDRWKCYWIPSFCQAILVPSLNRRKQVIAFCVPRIVDLMREIESLKVQVPLVFVGLLNEIETFLAESLHVSTWKTTYLFDSLSDRILWAQLEIARYSSLMKVSDGKLKETISRSLPRERFQFALVHSLPFVRIVAFKAMKYVVSSYDSTRGLEEEATMWKFALPYSIKTTESKEFLSNLLQCLCHFLDRLSMCEAESNADSGCDVLPVVNAFVVDFLVGDVILDKGAYIGTIADKEIFGVSLLDCLLAFALQDESYSGDNTIVKKDAIFNRKRLPKEVATMNEILKALARRDVLSSLFGLLHSVWDNTREMTFQYLIKMVVACQSRKLALAAEYCDQNQRRHLLARGVYLASSPRQRESDTGARILCFLYASLPGRAEKDSFLATLVDISMDRVSSMKSTLNDITIFGKSASTKNRDGSCLPLAHGLIHAIRLCIEHDKTSRRLCSATPNNANINLNESMIEVFCKALQLSLSVVADVRDGETVDGIDEEAFSDSTPLNVNTGAIGANGTFSSVSATNTEETQARLAMQRVVVGSWLLTKESCGAISSVILIEGYVASQILVSKVGQLLLSTLTTLKHAGAAFSARDALQLIATNSLHQNKPLDIRSLPDTWSRRLIDEISLNEKVRNSTLRRSTGYALGFLAIMRSDVANKSEPCNICNPTLQQLFKLSLPPERRTKEALAKLNMSEDKIDPSQIFVYATTSCMRQPYILDSQYETRCRVHALNVLRMIILDAPLASVIGPLVGDTIIASILGYDDPSWAIRNSSTMVFAAAMLRVIDSDKNASNIDKTSSNAITLTELFRRYPPLAVFIPSVLRICLEEMESKGNVKSEMFPILLLLSRVQPVIDSSTAISEEFVPLLFRCLGSKDNGIRHAAARSLANLSSKNTSVVVLSDCKQFIERVSCHSMHHDWNRLDGMLLVMDSLDLSSSNNELFDMKQNLIRIVKSSGFPPPCRSRALAILLSSSTYIENGDNAVCRACEEISKCDRIGSMLMIGGSLLYKTASEALCRMYQGNLWEPKSKSALENSLSHLKNIFVSNIIDIRLYGVKCFKKGIYDNLDRIRMTENNAMDVIEDATVVHSPDTILIGLAKMLLDCVADELNRDIVENTGGGAHVPTLRRLSRCFLETIDAIPTPVLSSLNCSELLWSVSNKIVDREEYLFSKEGTGDAIESNGGTVLSSNAAEMMALAIVMGHNNNYGPAESENGTKDCYYYERIKVLLVVVDGLNDPVCSWRSRYSAALSLETCCHLVLSNNVDEVVDDEENQRDILRRTILIHILKMLQDSDPDVRTVAVRAATKFNRKRGQCVKDQNRMLSSSCHHLLLPEWTLERTFPSTFAPDDARKAQQQYSTTETLMGMILDHCRGIIDMIKNVQDEFRHTNQFCDDNDDGLKLLVNVNTTRMIFEEEDPNPFQEKILLNQLAIRSLLDLVLVTTPGQQQQQQFNFLLPTNLIHDVLMMCDSVLNLLLESQNNGGGMVHEITRFPTIFPSLHSILCASIASVYLMGGVEEAAVVTNNGEDKNDNDNEDSSNESDVSLLQSVLRLRTKIRNSAEQLLLVSFSLSTSSDDNDSNVFLMMHPTIHSALRVFIDLVDNNNNTLSSSSQQQQQHEHKQKTKHDIIELLFLLKHHTTDECK